MRKIIILLIYRNFKKITLCENLNEEKYNNDNKIDKNMFPNKEKNNNYNNVEFINNN